MTALPRTIAVALALVVAAPGSAHASSSWRARWRAGLDAGWLAHPGARGGTARAGTLATGDGPAFVALDPATRTLYVSNGAADSVAVLDVSRCTARDPSGCGDPVATVKVGPFPFGLVLDARTHTLYAAASGDRTVSVVDVSHCTAGDVTGCHRPPATVPVDADPAILALDAATDTVYVGSFSGDSLPVIDGRTCNAAVTTGCAGPVAYAQAGPQPVDPALDPATRTLYVPNADDDQGTTVSVIDARACNSGHTAGCGATPPALTAGNGVSDVAFDDATHTVFVIDAGDGTVSVFDGATCNGAVSSGCGQQAATTAVGIFPVAGLAFDPATRTLFVPEGQGRVFAVDTRHCRAGDATGCGRAWPALQAGAAPNWIANDPATSTLYVPNFFDADVSVLDGAGCNALRTTTCRHEAPSIALQEAIVIAVDPAVHTAYVTNGDFHKLAMFDTRTCSARHPGGCTPVLADMTGMSGPWGIALDPGTQTLYLGNFSDQDVVLLDPARCNYGHPAGCVPLAPRIPVGAGPVELSVNARTHMVYVGDTDAGAISAIDGTHCHVGDLSGCGAPVTTTPTGLGAPWNLFADASTNTIYVPGLGQPDADGVLDGHRVGVIDGAHCCAVKATVEVGIAPFDVGADPATHTLYVANSAIAEFGVNGPGTVSVVDTRHCEGTDVSGCGQTPSLVHTGLDPRDVFVDSPSHRVYIADNDNATMSVIDTRRCSAVHPAGCAQPPGRIAVGSFPRDAALDPDSGTLYVASNLFKAVSLVDTRQQAGR